MTKEEKEILIKDLSARLLYGVLIQEDYLVHDKMFLPDEETDRLINIDVSDGTLMTNGGSFYHIDEIKPYLFPLSSMTEEQIKEFNSITQKCSTYIGKSILLTDFCNKNHIDYRGLISMGLADDASNLNIY